MIDFPRFFTGEFTYALGWTIVHSFWQFALVACLLWLVLRSSKMLSSNTRYLMACSALLLCFVISLLTFHSYFALAQQARVQMNVDSLNAPLQQVLNAQSLMQTWLARANNYLSLIVNAWLLGFLYMGIKSIVDYVHCIKLRNENTQKVSSFWQTRVDLLAKQVGIGINVKIMESTNIIAPCTLGYFKPLILIPVGLLTNMTQAQVEVILLHELGHIRRNDYAVGLVQMLLKVIFFFNPMASWISSIIDQERENACDDIAVDICKDVLFFSTTLKEFAAMSTQKSLSLSINDNKMHLLNRIKRQFRRVSHRSRAVEKLVATLAVFLCCMTATVYAQTNGPAAGIQEKTEEAMLKSPMFEKIAEQDRLTAVKDFLAEYDESYFSTNVLKEFTLQEDKYFEKTILVSLFKEPLKTKISISRAMLESMRGLEVTSLSSESVVLFKDPNNNYVIAFNNSNKIESSNINQEKLVADLTSACLSSMRMNGFYAKNNLQGYKSKTWIRNTDLTFSVSPDYWFVMISPKFVEYALSMSFDDAGNDVSNYRKNSIVPGGRYAGAELTKDQSVDITYDRGAWQHKGEWMRQNGLFGNSTRNSQKYIAQNKVEKGRLPTANKDQFDTPVTTDMLDDRRKKLMLTDKQLDKAFACFCRHRGTNLPESAKYNMEQGLISRLLKMNDQQLAEMEIGYSEKLKKYPLGSGSDAYFVNLLDDSNKTPEDPEGLASCDVK